MASRTKVEVITRFYPTWLMGQRPNYCTPGQVFQLDSQVASYLIKRGKVAKYSGPTPGTIITNYEPPDHVKCGG